MKKQTKENPNISVEHFEDGYHKVHITGKLNALNYVVTCPVCGIIIAEGLF